MQLASQNIINKNSDWISPKRYKKSINEFKFGLLIPSKKLLIPHIE